VLLTVHCEKLEKVLQHLQPHNPGGDHDNVAGLSDSRKSQSAANTPSVNGLKFTKKRLK
jgi:hypothetical protein